MPMTHPGSPRSTHPRGRGWGDKKMHVTEVTGGGGSYLTQVSELLTQAVFGAKWRGWERASGGHVCMNVYADVCIGYICMCERVLMCS